MPETPLNLAVIIGSTRQGRFGDTVARWFTRQAEPRADMVLDLIDLAELDLPPCTRAGPTPPSRRTSNASDEPMRS